MSTTLHHLEFESMKLIFCVLLICAFPHSHAAVLPSGENTWTSQLQPVPASMDSEMTGIQNNNQPDVPNYIDSNPPITNDLKPIEENPQNNEEANWEDFERLLDQGNQEGWGEGDSAQEQDYPRSGYANTEFEYSNFPVEFTPLGKAPPNGVAREKNVLNREFGDYFNSFDDEIAFELPTDLQNNCWLQSMLATQYGFGPSCNADGTYSSKQCHKKRCWCTDQRGLKTQTTGGTHDDGFYFGLPALMLQCSHNKK